MLANHFLIIYIIHIYSLKPVESRFVLETSNSQLSSLNKANLYFTSQHCPIFFARSFVVPNKHHTFEHQISAGHWLDWYRSGVNQNLHTRYFGTYTGTRRKDEEKKGGEEDQKEEKEKMLRRRRGGRAGGGQEEDEETGDEEDMKATAEERSTISGLGALFLLFFLMTLKICCCRSSKRSF